MKRAKYQFSIRQTIVITVCISIGLAVGRVFGKEFSLAVSGLVVLPACATYATISIVKSRRMVIALHLPSAMIICGFFASILCRFIDWDSSVHTVCFVFSVILLIYWLGERLGFESPIQLDLPQIGIPLCFLFGFLVWLAYFGSNIHQTNPLMLTLTLFLAAPFVLSTFHNLVGLS